MKTKERKEEEHKKKEMKKFDTVNNTKISSKI